MKIRIFTIALISSFLFSCGSSESVIMEDGSVYEVKGKTFKTNGADVSESLTDDEKQNIRALITKKREAQEEAERLQKELERQQEDLEKAQEQARKKQEDLEDKQRDLESKLKAQEEAREDYLKAKKRLADQQEKYKNLRDKGKLSPRDEASWAEKLAEIQAEVDTAQKRMDNLK
ncbi:hypothetical protein [Psychroserpens sp.]|uniref:hypothetical protein n=1 Tax=Psychroserpens sp. TaxID=2020870 RepID=UPI003C7408DE